MSDFDNNDFVASILLKDAEARAAKSRTEGVHAFLVDPVTGQAPGLNGGRARPNAPKPNTRFLKNIVKEAQEHNRALLKKEEEDAKRRLKGLKAVLGGSERERRGDEERHGRKKSDWDKGKERDRDGDRRRGREGGSRRSRSRSRSRSPRKHHRSTRERSRSRDRHRHRSEERDRSRDERKKDKDRRSRRDRSASRERHRSRSRTRRNKSVSPSRRKHHTASHSQSESSRKKRRPSIEPYVPRHKRTRHSPSPQRSPTPPRKSTARRSVSPCPTHTPSSPSIGPSAPSQPRGRGTAAGTSKMDTHFSPTYDPKADIDLESEEDTWEDALDAYRDRQKFRQLGGERLRQAGFSEEQVRRWEGGEKVEEVRWAKKGEGREWDRGKVWDEGGDGWTVKAGWGK